MTNVIELLTTFRGRINRARWWLGFVITLIASVAGTILFNPQAIFGEGVPPPNWPDTIWQLALLIPGTAITVKRFNDRDWPWWLGYAFGAFGALIYILPHAGLLIDPDGDWPGAIAFWLFFAALIAAFVDNGFLRGTRGPNRYGPDPLAEGQPPA
jgi:uncharacterized membrane protein YhaH (DUF805 family)